MSPPALSRVLVVEDDPDIQAVVAYVLGEVGGLEVELCGSGRDALARVEAFRPDLVLLDVMLPDLDGPATLRALRARPETAALPVVFMTARVQPRDLDAYRDAGACEVLVKPFDAAQLHERLAETWSRIHGAAAG